MSDSNRIAVTAALLGDPARANMLAALMDGRALTAKELAYAAHVTAQTASGHLAELSDGGVLAVAGPDPARPTTWRGGEALRTARTCYDHLAGRLAVALTDALTERGHV